MKKELGRSHYTFLQTETYISICTSASSNSNLGVRLDLFGLLAWFCHLEISHQRTGGDIGRFDSASQTDSGEGSRSF